MPTELAEILPKGRNTVIVNIVDRTHGGAIDASGDLYVPDSGNNQVVKVTSGGAQSTVVTGLNAPFGVTVDTAGTLYVGWWLRITI